MMVKFQNISKKTVRLQSGYQVNNPKRTHVSNKPSHRSGCTRGVRERRPSLACASAARVRRLYMCVGPATATHSARMLTGRDGLSGAYLSRGFYARQVCACLNVQWVKFCVTYQEDFIKQKHSILIDYFLKVSFRVEIKFSNNFITGVSPQFYINWFLNEPFS